MKKLLIIYYSWSNGNTERIAKMLQSENDSDILKIDTVVPYTGSYDDVVNQGQNEVQRGYEPEIKPLDINIADYDVIAVGQMRKWTCDRNGLFEGQCGRISKTERRRNQHPVPQRPDSLRYLRIPIVITWRDRCSSSSSSIFRRSLVAYEYFQRSSLHYSSSLNSDL